MASRNPVIADHPRPAPPRLINQPVQAERGEPVAPPPHRAGGQAQSFGKRRDSAQAAQPVDGIDPTRRGRRVDDLLVAVIRAQPRPRHRSTDFVDSMDNTESACISNPTLVPLKLTGGLLRVVARPPNKGIALDTGTPMLHSRRTTGTVPTAHATMALRPR